MIAGLLYSAVLFFWLCTCDGHVTTTEFANMESCKVAADKLLRSHGRASTRAVCVDKFNR